VRPVASTPTPAVSSAHPISPAASTRPVYNPLEHL
jgi:hypothetical protein